MEWTLDRLCLFNGEHDVKFNLMKIMNKCNNYNRTSVAQTLMAVSNTFLRPLEKIPLVQFLE